MRTRRTHPRIIEHSFAPLMLGARLSAFYDTGQDLFLDVDGLEVSESELFEREGKLLESCTGSYLPLRLHFSGVYGVYCDDFVLNLDEYPQDAPARTIFHLLSWRQPKKPDVYYRFGLQGDDLHFFARRVTCEKLDRPPLPLRIERDWSPAPPMPARLVPRPKKLYRQFGGDPVTIRINGNTRHRRLFVGELNIQPRHRPQVDAILNLGEQSSRWVKPTRLHSNDRAIKRGEGSEGMTVAEICEEAGWVIERLEQNQRVLVHCVAGMNRSVTVCCAALMLLEGLNAQAALERVREHHPWARPDSHHWLALRWLENHKQE